MSTSRKLPKPVSHVTGHTKPLPKLKSLEWISQAEAEKLGMFRLAGYTDIKRRVAARFGFHGEFSIAHDARARRPV